MYLQQTRIQQFLINVFLYHDDFENSGEKNKRGSVDLYMFTGVSTFLRNGNALTLSRLPQFPGLIVLEISHHNQPIFATPSSDSQLLLFKIKQVLVCIHQFIHISGEF